MGTYLRRELHVKRLCQRQAHASAWEDLQCGECLRCISTSALHHLPTRVLKGHVLDLARGEILKGSVAVTNTCSGVDLDIPDCVTATW